MGLKPITKILETDNSSIVRSIVLDKAQKNNQVIYGARAINRQLPTYLEKNTSDYDVLTKKPKRTAKETMETLNRRIGRKEYKVVEAKHKGTYRVQDLKGNTVVDYTQLKGNPKVKKSWGNNYVNLKSIKKNIQKSLKNPKNEFRREKDEDSLKRIKFSEDTFDF